MSEYQYYEFQAIDRPLDRAAQKALRSISSRARITATSFTNHYEWGDLKGERVGLHDLGRSMTWTVETLGRTGPVNAAG